MPRNYLLFHGERTESLAHSREVREEGCQSLLVGSLFVRGKKKIDNQVQGVVQGEKNKIHLKRSLGRKKKKMIGLKGTKEISELSIKKKLLRSALTLGNDYCPPPTSPQQRKSYHYFIIIKVSVLYLLLEFSLQGSL